MLCAKDAFDGQILFRNDQQGRRSFRGLGEGGGDRNSGISPFRRRLANQTRASLQREKKTFFSGVIPLEKFVPFSCPLPPSVLLYEKEALSLLSPLLPPPSPTPRRVPCNFAPPWPERVATDWNDWDFSGKFPCMHVWTLHRENLTFLHFNWIWEEGERADTLLRYALRTCVPVWRKPRKPNMQRKKSFFVEEVPIYSVCQKQTQPTVFYNIFFRSFQSAPA